jgi:hypothetical protein
MPRAGERPLRCSRFFERSAQLRGIPGPHLSEGWRSIEPSLLMLTQRILGSWPAHLRPAPPGSVSTRSNQSAVGNGPVCASLASHCPFASSDSRGGVRQRQPASRLDRPCRGRRARSHRGDEEANHRLVQRAGQIQTFAAARHYILAELFVQARKASAPSAADVHPCKRGFGNMPSRAWHSSSSASRVCTTSWSILYWISRKKRKRPVNFGHSAPSSSR